MMLTMNSKHVLSALLATVLLHGSGIPASVASNHPVATATPAAEAVIEGEVRKVDKDAQKVTLKHGPSVNLEMPEITMVFRASDPKFLEGVKPGDKVRFRAEKIDGVFTVVALERLK